MSSKRSKDLSARSSSNPVTWRLVRRLASRLYSGVKDAFWSFFSLGAFTAGVLSVLDEFSGIGKAQTWILFFVDLGDALSSISPIIFLVSIFLLCFSVALSGYDKTPGWIERYLIHPLLALVSDTAASALGYFFVSTLVALIKDSGQFGSSAQGLWYFILAAPILWIGRAIGSRHASSIAWGTRRKPKANNLRRVLIFAGIGGAVAALVIVIAIAFIP